MSDILNFRMSSLMVLFNVPFPGLYVQVRRNKFVEILPINVGCLGACTYCKTKHARGHLGSYTVDSLVGVVSFNYLCLIHVSSCVTFIYSGWTCQKRSR